MKLPPLSMHVELHMRKRFPGYSHVELLLLHSTAWCWVSRHVFAAHMDPEPHPLLVTAAMFYMFHVCEKEPKTKAAHLFNAHELLSIFG
jgi:hypothetical protein